MQSEIEQENLFLTDCSSELSFIALSGSELRSLTDLLTYVRKVSDDEFYHHSNIHKCDFSNWVWDVVQDRVLATDLFVARGNRDRLVARLSIRLSELGEIDLL